MDDRELKAISRRPLRAWSEDGLTDIASGVFFLVFAGYYWADRSSNPFLSLAMSFLILALTLLQPRAVRLAKERLVFPRTGSVVLRGRELTWGWTIGIGLALSSLAVIVMLNPAAFSRWGPMVLGAALTVGFLVTWWWLDLRRYLLLASVSAAITMVIEAFGLRRESGFAVLSLVLGGAQVVTGTLVLLFFLRANSLAPQE